jgi:aldehyde dehydrogenase (NAD+)
MKPSMRVRKEEMFGPVLPVVSYEKEDEGTMIAYDTIYGLGGYIYTASRARAGAARIADANRHGLP